MFRRWQRCDELVALFLKLAFWHRLQIGSVTTDQGKRGWVYDIQRSTKGTKYAGKSRYFYLDGVLKASSEAAPASHESFVHPSMLAHDDPKSVLAFGSTTGGIVKEILKHKSVEHVALAGVDKSLLQFARENLRTWNDCSDLDEGLDQCLDDPRVQVQYGNPGVWLESNYTMTQNSTSDRFDVVLVDVS